MHRKRLSHSSPAIIRQLHDLNAPVHLVTFTRHEPVALQVVHHGRHIAAAAEDFLAQLPLRERAEMVQRLEHGELAFGEAEFLLERRNELRLHRVDAPSKLDEGVQRKDFVCCSLIATGHYIVVECFDIEIYMPCFRFARSPEPASSVSLHPMQQRDKDSEGAGKVRIDKWLWAARFFKTRALAVEAIGGGKILVHGERVKPAKVVQAGDQVSVRLGPYEHIVTVRGVSERRGPASVAATLYEETSESLAARQKLAEQLRMAPAAFVFEEKGRPTKKDRRDIERLRDARRK